MQLSKGALLAVVVVVGLVAAGFHYRYLLMKTERRHGLLMFDERGKSLDCYLVDTKRAALKGLGKGEVTEESMARMFRLSDGLEASFCEKHPELRNQEIVVLGVRTSGDAIGQDCSNRSCFRLVRLE